MLTRADLWILVLAILGTGLIISLACIPAWLADRKPVEPAPVEARILAALARRVGLDRDAR